MFDSSNRKLVRVCGRAYVWVSVFNVVILDENQRNAIPFGNADHYGQPCAFQIELNGWLSILPHCEYVVLDAEPYERLSLPNTYHLNASYPVAPAYKAVMVSWGGQVIENRPGYLRWVFRVRVYSDLPGTADLNWGDEILAIMPDNIRVGENFPLPEGMLTIEGQNEKQAVASILQLHNVPYFQVVRAQYPNVAEL